MSQICFVVRNKLIAIVQFAVIVWKSHIIRVHIHIVHINKKKGEK